MVVIPKLRLSKKLCCNYRDGKSWGSVANFEDLKVALLLIGTIFFDEDKSHMHVILRTISSFFPHQKILFLSKVMPLKICDTSPGFAISIA